MSANPTRQFIAFGKVSAQWHAVAHDGAGGYILRALGSRRRRIFTAAELAPCVRFINRDLARLAGRACGLARTYATLEPLDSLPSPNDLAARPIIARLEPRNAAEAAELSRYITTHQSDHAAALNLTREQLAERLMLTQMRQSKNLRSLPGVRPASELPLKFEP